MSAAIPQLLAVWCALRVSVILSIARSALSCLDFNCFCCSLAVELVHGFSSLFQFSQATLQVHNFSLSPPCFFAYESNAFRIPRNLGEWTGSCPRCFCDLSGTGSRNLDFGSRLATPPQAQTFWSNIGGNPTWTRGSSPIQMISLVNRAGLASHSTWRRVHVRIPSTICKFCWIKYERSRKGSWSCRLASSIRATESKGSSSSWVYKPGTSPLLKDCLLFLTRH